MLHNLADHTHWLAGHTAEPINILYDFARYNKAQHKYTTSHTNQSEQVLDQPTDTDKTNCVDTTGKWRNVPVPAHACANASAHWYDSASTPQNNELQPMHPPASDMCIAHSELNSTQSTYTSTNTTDQLPALQRDDIDTTVQVYAAELCAPGSAVVPTPYEPSGAAVNGNVRCVPAGSLLNAGMSSGDCSGDIVAFTDERNSAWSAEFRWSSLMRDYALQLFGVHNFRPLQREIINCTMSRQDVFVLMPTGSGTYQRCNHDYHG